MNGKYHARRLRTAALRAHARRLVDAAARRQRRRELHARIAEEWERGKERARKE